MRHREKERFEGKFERMSAGPLGESVYFRPFESDAKMIAEIAKFVGEGKSDVARKLVHAALTGREVKLAENRLEEKIDWLIRSTRQNEGLVGALLEGSTADNRRLEKIERLLRQQQLLNSELYCMTSVAVSSLKQTFAKLLEFLSPVELERKHSIHVANQIMTALIEHAVEDLKRCIVHHGIVDTQPNELYVSSKSEALKKRLGEL